MSDAPQPYLELHQGSGAWMITFHHDAEVQELFGTNVLPTSFNRSAPAQFVLAEIQKRNPTKTVLVRTE